MKQLYSISFVLLFMILNVFALEESFFLTDKGRAYAAIQTGNIGALCNLIDGGVDVNEEIIDGQRLVHLVSFWGSLAMLELLLEKGSQVSTPDNLRKTALHYAAIGISPEKVQIMKRLLEMTADINAQDRYGNTPLHCLLRHDRKATESILFFINEDADLNVKNDTGEFPLDSFAIKKGKQRAYFENFETVEVLVQNGAKCSSKQLVLQSSVILCAGRQ